MFITEICFKRSLTISYHAICVNIHLMLILQNKLSFFKSEAKINLMNCSYRVNRNLFR